MLLPDDIVKLDDLCPNDPHLLNYMPIDGLGLGCAKAKSDYYRFARVLLSFPSSSGIEYDFNLGTEFSRGPSDGVH